MKEKIEEAQKILNDVYDEVMAGEDEQLKTMFRIFGRGMIDKLDTMRRWVK
jgi:hypothetical protein